MTAPTTTSQQAQQRTDDLKDAQRQIEAETTPQASPDPRQLMVSAKKVCVIGVLGQVVNRGRWIMDPDPIRAENALKKALQKWGRFSLVQDPAQADLTMVIVEGNQSGTFVKGTLIERLLVLRGGAPPDNNSVPLWQGEGKETLGGRPAGKLVEQFRKQIEEYERAGVTPISLPPVGPATEKAFAEPETAGPVTPVPLVPGQPGIAEPAEGKPAEPTATTQFNPTEALLSAKTIALVVSAPDIGGTGKEILGSILRQENDLSLMANVRRATKDATKAITKWKRYTLVENPAQADLVLHVSEWDHSRIFRHYLAGRIVVYQGGANWQENQQLIWAKEGETDFGSVTAGLMAEFRKDVEKLSKEVVPK